MFSHHLAASTIQGEGELRRHFLFRRLGFTSATRLETPARATVSVETWQQTYYIICLRAPFVIRRSSSRSNSNSEFTSFSYAARHASLASSFLPPTDIRDGRPRPAD